MLQLITRHSLHLFSPTTPFTKYKKSFISTQFSAADFSLSKLFGSTREVEEKAIYLINFSFPHFSRFSLKLCE
jgi:hypothetical protein